MAVPMSYTAAVLSIALGFLICFFGYRVLRVTLGIMGFFAGASLGGVLSATIPNVSQVFVLIIALVCGIIGAILAAVLYKAGVFLLGAGAGMLLGGMMLVGTGQGPSTLVLVLCGIVAGLLTLFLQRFLVSVLTAFAGAWGMVAGVAHLFRWFNIQQVLPDPRMLQYAPVRFWVMMAGWVVLGIAGAAVQIAGKRKK